MQDPAKGPRGDQLTQSGDSRRPAEGEPDPDHGVSVAGGLGHRPSVLEGVAQRLLAQHVLTRGHQAFHHLPVQEVGDHHTDDVDVGVLSDGLPGRVGTLVAETARGQVTKLWTHVRDRDVAKRWQDGFVQGWGAPVRGGVGPAGHAGSDHGNTNRHGPLLVTRAL